MTPTHTDDMRSEFEAWYCKEYGDMFPLARWTAEGDYHSPKAVKHWKTWQAAYTRPVPAGVVEEWNPDAVLARIQSMECDHKVGATNPRTKADEWEACYALLFKHLQEIVKAHPQPAVVSLDNAARGYCNHLYKCEVYDEYTVDTKQHFKGVCAAVLNAAGVAYVE